MKKNILLFFIISVFLLFFIGSNVYADEGVIVEDIERLTDDDLAGIDKKYIDGLRLKELPANFRGNREDTVLYVKKYVEKLISKEK